MIDPEQNAPGTHIEAPGLEDTSVAATAAPAEAALETPHAAAYEPAHAAADDDLAAEQPDDLHDLFTVPAADDPLAAMREDPNYSALIKELEYIAAQARMLFQPAEEAPSDDVWTKIQSQLPTISEEPTR